jgi:hypothetical protein
VNPNPDQLVMLAVHQNGTTNFFQWHDRILPFMRSKYGRLAKCLEIGATGYPQPDPIPVLAAQEIADDNAMYRFRHFKPEDYNKFLQTLPLQRMPEAKEYLPFIKILCGQNSQVFSGSLVCMDTGQGTSINQVF